MGLNGNESKLPFRCDESAKPIATTCPKAHQWAS